MLPWKLPLNVWTELLPIVRCASGSNCWTASELKHPAASAAAIAGPLTASGNISPQKIQEIDPNENCLRRAEMQRWISNGNQWSTLML